MIQHPAQHLTDNYRKDEDSNNYKLLSLGHGGHTEIFDNLRMIEASRDIDEAAGFTLDKAGKNVLELRDGRDDDAFRRAIKIKIRGNLSSGTIEDINDICEILFDEHFITVQETWDSAQYGHEPAAMIMSLKDNPEARNLFLHYINEMMMAVKAGGVRLYSRITSDSIDAMLQVYTALPTDYTRFHIPTAALNDMDIPGELFAGVFMRGISYMRIQTADLREANRIE